MNIKEGIDHDLSSNTYIGNVIFPNLEGKANQALVFIIGGISSRWKQTIAYFFTNGKADGGSIKKTQF